MSVRITAHDLYVDGFGKDRVILTIQYSEGGTDVGESYQVDCAAADIDTTEKATAFLAEVNIGMAARNNPQVPDLGFLDGLSSNGS